MALTQRTNRLNYTRRRRGCRWGRTTPHLPGAFPEPSVACPQAGLVLGAARARHGPTRARPRGRRAGRRARELHVEGVRVGQVRRARPGGTRGRPARRAAPLSFFVPPARAPRRGRLRYGEIWGDMGRYGEMWGGVGRCGEMWGDVGRCGEMWGDMGRYGTSRSRCRGRADQPRQKVFEEHRRRVRQQHVVSRLATSEE